MNEDDLGLDKIEEIARIQHSKLIGARILRASFQSIEGDELVQELSNHKPYEVFEGLLAIASVLIMETADDMETTPVVVLDTLIELMTTGSQ